MNAKYEEIEAIPNPEKNNSITVNGSEHYIQRKNQFDITLFKNEQLNC